MEIQGRIGFLGGGRMAEALVKGLLLSGVTVADRITVVDPDEGRRQLLRSQYKVAVAAEAVEALAGEIVVLAVKPQVVGKVLAENRNRFNENHLLISIAAGISLKSLETALAAGASRVIRVMPNTPALVLAGVSALSPGGRATGDDLETARRIFGAVGECVVLSEKEMDAVTGLSGSGPAYVFSFLEALVDSGVKVGLSRPVAEILARQTLLGSAMLARETGDHPAVLKAMVTSPGGTTIAGLHVMEKAGFTGIMMDAVEAATKRSVELGLAADDTP